MTETQMPSNAMSVAASAAARAGALHLNRPAAPAVMDDGARPALWAGNDSGAQKYCLPAACLASLLDELDTGVVVCDPSGRALLVNEAARREMASGDLLHLGKDGELCVPAGASQLALQRAVHGAAWERRHQLLPLRCGDKLLMVGVQPLRATSANQPCAVLLLGRRSLCADLAVHRLGGLYDLTGAEKEVLTSLLAGTRVSTLARLRGVAVSTVRTQVAALRAKFGVKRVDDLTRLAAELPPMMSALRGPLVKAAGSAAAGASGS